MTIKEYIEQQADFYVNNTGRFVQSHDISYSAGAEAMIQHMGKILEWADKNAWLTTSELLEEYFKTLQP